MDVAKIRSDFPMFQNQKEPFVYLDNGATTQKPKAVIERISRYYAGENSNIHRGAYPLSRHASQLYENARKTVQQWLDAESADEIVFTKSSTEAVNLVAAAAFDTFIGKGDNVIVTELEHSSNYFPWKHHCEKNGAEFRVAAAAVDGSLKPEVVLSLMDQRTKLIAVTAMSNATGFRPDLARIIEEAHRNKVPVLVDASQEAVHRIISVQRLECDFLCFSGHKIYGPMGTGVLYGRKAYLEELAPYLYGGDMVLKGNQGELIYREDAGKYEAGTQNIGGVLGLEAALTYLKENDFADLISYEADLSRYLRARLEAIQRIRIAGPKGISPVLSFEIQGLGAYDIGVLLAGRGIAVRTGAHCAYPLMQRMGKESICRISLAFYNTKKELDVVADRLEEICGGRI